MGQQRSFRLTVLTIISTGTRASNANFYLIHPFERSCTCHAKPLALTRSRINSWVMTGECQWAITKTIHFFMNVGGHFQYTMGMAIACYACSFHTSREVLSGSRLEISTTNPKFGGRIDNPWQLSEKHIQLAFAFNGYLKWAFNFTRHAISHGPSALVESYSRVRLFMD